jgi:hypothetical protein
MCHKETSMEPVNLLSPPKCNPETHGNHKKDFIYEQPWFKPSPRPSNKVTEEMWFKTESSKALIKLQTMVLTWKKTWPSFGKLYPINISFLSYSE